LTENQRILADRYTVGGLIGRGGMADVYEGTDNRLGRKVAIKLLKSDLANDPTFEARFKQEAQASARMAHPTIVRVYDAGEEISTDSNGNERRTPYIVMEYVRGTLLRDLIHDRALSVPETLGYAEGVLTALEFSHRAGVIHRDIKSANIMITDTGLVKVMDFGIARAISDSSTTQAHTVGIVGTAQYFSPEQARGETVDARTDLYSTGVLLYEMLAGRPPFKGDTAVSVAYQHVSEAVTPPSVYNPEISSELNLVVLRALAKDRNDRYQSAEEFREHLLAADTSTPAPVTEAVAETVVLETSLQTEPTTEAEPLDEFEALLAAATESTATSAVPIAPTPTVAAPLEAEPEKPVYRPSFADSTPPTELISTDTNPFGALGVNFNNDSSVDATALAEVVGAVATKKPLLQNPGFLWGAGSASVVFVIGMLIWVFSLALPSFSPNPSGIKVADVVGSSYQSAFDSLTAQKLLVDRQYEVSDTVAVDSVIRTDPAAGTSVSENTTITVFVSTGKTPVDMPELKGMTELMASDLLGQSKLVLGEILQAHSATVPQGQVIETDPAAGTKIAEGTVVNLTISDGLVVVPDVRNYSISEAKGLLTSAAVGLTVEIGTMDACDTDPQGTIVLDQSILPGTTAAGSVITLFVSCTP
jgi:serine/threonine-protein kinase